MCTGVLVNTPCYVIILVVSMILQEGFTFGTLYFARSAEEGLPQNILRSNPTVPAFKAARSVSLILGIIPNVTPSGDDRVLTIYIDVS